MSFFNLTSTSTTLLESSELSSLPCSFEKVLIIIIVIIVKIKIHVYNIYKQTKLQNKISQLNGIIRYNHLSIHQLDVYIGNMKRPTISYDTYTSVM